MKKRYIILIFVMIILSSLMIFYLSYYKSKNSIQEVLNLNQLEKSSLNQNDIIVTKKSEKLKNIDGVVGNLTIESIGIIGENVVSGVDEGNLKVNICHFPNTAQFNGNICIAAHNYSIESSNLFKNLEKIKIGDIVSYKTSFGKREYKVKSIERIFETNLSVLENTADNIITMITCVNDRKDMRLCVKASELKEEK